MPRLSKPDLLRQVEDAYRLGGWNVLYLSALGEHPGRYRVYKDEVSETVRVYIWNVSHGGGAARSAAEYRIQITGLGSDQFAQEIGGKTLILGYWPNEEVFAGFDYRRHSGHLGGSPSMQIGIAALRAAITNGFATHRKNTGELAIAFRTDFMGTYTENLEALHDTGTAPEACLARPPGSRSGGCKRA
jgi:putative restriction endonuclease